MSVAGFSVKNKVTIAMFTLIVVLIGIISFSKLGLDLMPDIDYPTISVVVNYSGSAPEDIEQMVSRRLEQWVSTVPKVRKVQSVSKEGISVLNIEFEWGTNLDFAAQDVREVIGLYEKLLPENASKPVVIKFNLSQIPVIMYGVTGDRSLFELEKITKDKIVEHLQRIEGVASTMVFNAEVREFHVCLKGQALSVLKISPDRVLQILAAENINQPAGYLIQDKKEYILRTVGEIKDLATIRRIPVGYTAEGKIVRLSEVATVSDTKKDVRLLSRMDKKPSLFCVVSKASGANSVIVADKVKEAIAEVKTTLPKDIDIPIMMDTSEDIKRVSSGTIRDVFFGGLLVIVVVFIFLSNWRPTLTISLSIPLSIIATFISFYVAGYTLNLITLMGLGLGIGMLVDNSVVVIENIFRHYVSLGEELHVASKIGAEEVTMAITASTFTTIGVFFPMLFATGMVGKFAQALTLSVCFALLSSLIVALTMVPMLTSFLFRGMSAGDVESKGAREHKFDRIKAFYSRLLDRALLNRKKVLGGVLIVFIASIGMIPFMGFEFMPTQDQSLALLKVSLPVGTPLDTTFQISRQLEDGFSAHPDVLSCGTIVGVNENDQGGGNDMTNPKGPHESVLWVRLKKKEDRKLRANQIVDQVKSKIPPYQGMKMDTIDFGAAFMGGSMYQVIVNIFGKELPLLEKFSDVVMQNMKSIEGFVDINSSYKKGKSEVQIVVDREKAYQLGLTVFSIADTIHTYTIGKSLTRFREKGEEYDIRVLLDENDRGSLDQIRNLPIITPVGQRVFLQDVARLRIGLGPLEIERENQIRKVSVYANIRGRDLGSVVAELKKNLDQFEKNMPYGYFLDYSGQYEDMKSAMKDLSFALLVALLLTYMIMASLFEHLLHPFIIMFTIPLALMGVIIALLLGGVHINVVVFMGVIILTGIAVNNGIVMVDFINQLRQRGMASWQAIVEGSATRLRPVLITSITTIFGMVPMIFTSGEGAEMRVPLGLTIVGGLCTATFLTLFVVPLLYAIFNKVKAK